MVALCSGDFLVYVFYGLFTLRIISFAQLLLNDCLVVVTRHVSPCPAHVIYALAGRGTHPMHTTGNAELGIRDGLPCMVLPPFIFYTQQCGCLGLRGHERSTEMQNWRWQGKAGGDSGLVCGLRTAAQSHSLQPRSFSHELAGSLLLSWYGKTQAREFPPPCPPHTTHWNLTA